MKKIGNSACHQVDGTGVLPPLEPGLYKNRGGIFLPVQKRKTLVYVYTVCVYLLCCNAKVANFFNTANYKAYP